MEHVEPYKNISGDLLELAQAYADYCNGIELTDMHSGHAARDMKDLENKFHRTVTKVLDRNVFAVDTDFIGE